MQFTPDENKNRGPSHNTLIEGYCVEATREDVCLRAMARTEI